MQVTRRIPEAVRSAVTLGTVKTAWPAKGFSLQSSTVRTADIHPRSSKIALFSQSARVHVEGRFTGASKEVPQEGDNAPETDIDEAIAQEKEKQTRAPWHREGSNTPPVARQRSAGAMTKGT